MEGQDRPAGQNQIQKVWYADQPLAQSQRDMTTHGPAEGKARMLQWRICRATLSNKSFWRN